MAGLCLWVGSQCGFTQPLALSRNHDGMIPTENMQINEFSWDGAQRRPKAYTVYPKRTAVSPGGCLQSLPCPTGHLGFRTVSTQCILVMKMSVAVIQAGEGKRSQSCLSYAVPHIANSEVVLLICSLITYPWWQSKSREK